MLLLFTFSRNRHDGCSGANAIADARSNLIFRRHQKVHSRAKLDQADALALLSAIAGFLPEHDSARQHSGDLLHHHHTLRARDCEDILFINQRCLGLRGHPEAAFVIRDRSDASRDGRAVDVHIEGRHKDADPPHRLALEQFIANFHHPAVGGRNDSVRLCGNNSEGITKEVQD